jgi:hypothetical protein
LFCMFIHEAPWFSPRPSLRDPWDFHL